MGPAYCRKCDTFLEGHTNRFVDLCVLCEYTIPIRYRTYDEYLEDQVPDFTYVQDQRKRIG